MQIPHIIDGIVIVNVDDKTLSELRQRWPLNRNFYASFLKSYYKNGAGPVATGMDLVFSGKSARSEEDAALAGALKNAGNVVIASYFDEEGRLSFPEEMLARSARAVGFISSPRDYDLAIRRAYPFVILKDGAVDYSFALKLFALAEKIDLSKAVYDAKKAVLILPPSERCPKGLSIHINGGDYTMKINYLAGPTDFKTVAFWKMLSPEGMTDAFTEKIVLLGTDIEMNHDVYPTPLGLMSGVAINANILAGLMSGRFLRETPGALTFALVVAAGLIIGFATTKFHNLEGLVLSAVLITACFYITAWLMSKDIIFDFFGFSLIVTTSFVSVAIFKHVVILIENTRLRKLAMTDALTGLYGFRYFEIRLNIDIKMAMSHNTDLSLMILDIDHFKEINDTYGHDIGNKILKKVASVIKKHVRHSDTVARFGGDEFAVILARSDIDNTRRLAENVRKAVAETIINWQGNVIKTTVSGGVSSLSMSTRVTAADLIKAADEALYKAKTGGRNSIACS